VHHAARRQRGEPIATSFVESAVDEIISWRMSKAQPMRWGRATVQLPRRAHRRAERPRSSRLSAVVILASDRQ
jgi:hypothetical protein